MNWYEVRKHNARRSAQKARGEQYKAERKARIERAGGPITVAELKSAARHIEPPNGNRINPVEVWTFRGADWVLGYSDGDLYQAFAPFQSWRMDPDLRQLVPMTPGAKKWITAQLAREQEATP